MKKTVITALVAATVLSFSAGMTSSTQAFSLGSLLKVGGVGFLADRFGGDINGVLNKILKQKNFESAYATKVVPIISLGGGNNTIGAAQVTGPSDSVDQVQAVAQFSASLNGVASAKVLIPVDSKNPVGASRVQGVGVSAIMDVRL